MAADPLPPGNGYARSIPPGLTPVRKGEVIRHRQQGPDARILSAQSKRLRRYAGMVQKIKGLSDDGTLMVRQYGRVANGLPLPLYNKEGTKVRRWAYPTLEHMLHANAWLADHYVGKPGFADPPKPDERPGLQIIFMHSPDYDPVALGRGNATRVIDAVGKDLGPAAAKEVGTHEVVDDV